MPGELIPLRRLMIEESLAQIEKLPPDEKPDIEKYFNFSDLSDQDGGQFEEMLRTIRVLRLGISRLVITMFRNGSLTFDQAADLLDQC